MLWIIYLPILFILGCKNKEDYFKNVPIIFERSSLRDFSNLLRAFFSAFLNKTKISENSASHAGDPPLDRIESNNGVLESKNRIHSTSNLIEKRNIDNYLNKKNEIFDDLFVGYQDVGDILNKRSCGAR